jgi:hypothetical protein
MERDNAGGGRRGLRATLSPELLEMVRDRYGLGSMNGVVDLGGSSSLNLLIQDRNLRYVVRVYRPYVTEARLRDLQFVRRELAAAGVPLCERPPPIWRARQRKSLCERPPPIWRARQRKSLHSCACAPLWYHSRIGVSQCRESPMSLRPSDRSVGCASARVHRGRVRSAPGSLPGRTNKVVPRTRIRCAANTMEAADGHPRH